MRIATGEIEQTIPDDGKDPAAKALGKKAARGAGVQQSHCIPLRLRGASPNALAASSTGSIRLESSSPWPRSPCRVPPFPIPMVGGQPISLGPIYVLDPSDCFGTKKPGTLSGLSRFALAGIAPARASVRFYRLAFHFLID